MADSAQITFDSKVWDGILKSLDKKWHDVKTRKTFGGIISASVFQDVMDHFQYEQGPDGKWPQWSDSYFNHMYRIGRVSNGLLQFSGKLRQSFSPNKFRSSSQGIIFYNNAETKGGFPYAAAHDEGGPKLPKRSFMWLSDRGMNNVVDRTLDWLLEGT